MKTKEQIEDRITRLKEWRDTHLNSHDKEQDRDERQMLKHRSELFQWAMDELKWVLE